MPCWFLHDSNQHNILFLSERVGGCRSLHLICAGICYQKPYGKDNGPGAVQQLLLCVWFSPMLMSDQGMEFCGKVIAAMCSLLSVEKIHTTPYHPQTNGSAERVHQTLQCMIGKLDPRREGSGKPTLDQLSV